MYAFFFTPAVKELAPPVCAEKTTFTNTRPRHRILVTDIPLYSHLLLSCFSFDWFYPKIPFMQIHVANLHSNLIEADILRLFSRFGEVDGIRLVRDKLNNRSLGRAFVDMPVQKQAAQAIVTLNGNDVSGKRLSVSEVMYDPAPNSSWNVSQDA
jgi:RNA recognition motif-containing protein